MGPYRHIFLAYIVAWNPELSSGGWETVLTKKQSYAVTKAATSHGFRRLCRLAGYHARVARLLIITPCTRPISPG